MNNVDRKKIEHLLGGFHAVYESNTASYDSMDVNQRGALNGELFGVGMQLEKLCILAMAKFRLDGDYVGAAEILLASKRWCSASIELLDDALAGRIQIEGALQFSALRFFCINVLIRGDRSSLEAAARRAFKLGFPQDETDVFFAWLMRSGTDASGIDLPMESLANLDSNRSRLCLVIRACFLPW